MTGFTYNGIHCSAFGLYYIPTKEDLWFQDPEYDVYSEDVDWRHGGYYYTSKAKVRTFSLKCYFEEIDVAKRQVIKNWLRMDSYGKLVFDDIPFVYWNVRPSKVITGSWYNDNNDSHSGKVDIQFKAYEPFGYLTRKSNNGTEDDCAEEYCNIISDSNMPAAPTTSSTSFNVYNPGTEACGLSIDIAGSTQNTFRFFNRANKTFCEFNSIPSSLRLAVNGDTGYVSTYVAGSSLSDNGFAYHNKGIVSLTPSRYNGNVPYVYGGLNGTLHTFIVSGIIVGEDLIDGVLVESGNQFIISDISASNNTLYCKHEGSVTVPSSGTCSVQSVNHIDIQEYTGSGWAEPSTLSLSYIKIDYQPRVM